MFTHILCPTDLKDRSDLAVSQAIRLAHQLGSKITLLNIHEEFMDKEEREMLRVSVSKMKEKYKQSAIDSKKEMKDIVHQMHGDDIAIDYLLHGGKPESAIVEVAANIGADLIIMVTDGRDNFLDYVAGTVTEHVINTARCPVLVVPYGKRAA
ncbi:MAG: universal stress protein [Desulfobacterales bacterium]